MSCVGKWPRVCVQGSFNPSGSEEADSDFDPEAGEAAAGAGRKRKASARRRSSAKPAGKRGRKPKGKKGRVSFCHYVYLYTALRANYSGSR